MYTLTFQMLGFGQDFLRKAKFGCFYVIKKII